MKKPLFLLPLLAALLCFGFTVQTESWTAEELKSANTAAGCRFMDSTERELVKYCNLARMYPKKFAKLEVQNYNGSVEQPEQYRNSENKRSLIRDLNASKPVGVLLPDSALTEMANCFQLELAASGKTGHDRKKCSEDYLAENCSFGKSTAKDIALQLLIDEGVASLGHRKNILNEKYATVGIAFGTHKVYRQCCVMDFR